MTPFRAFLLGVAIVTFPFVFADANLSDDRVLFAWALISVFMGVLFAYVVALGEK